MARTAFAPLPAVKNSGEAETSATIDQANGMVIAGADPEKTVLRVSNTGTAGNVIVRAAATGAAAGVLNAAWMRGQGDITVAVAATTGVSYLGPFDSAKVLQADGSMYVDFGAGVAGKLTALLLP